MSPSRKIKIFAADKSIVRRIENAIKTKGEFVFKTMDNGGQPHKVVINDNKVIFMDNSDDPRSGYDSVRNDKFQGFVKVVQNPDEIWIGTGADENVLDKSSKRFLGNTALVIKGNTATSLASSIHTFELSDGEHVTSYTSTVGNSGVPYGWIETNKGYYALKSFNCETGFLSHQDYDQDTLTDLSCWRASKKIKAIRKLKQIVPRY